MATGLQAPAHLTAVAAGAAPGLRVTADRTVAVAVDTVMEAVAVAEGEEEDDDDESIFNIEPFW